MNATNAVEPMSAAIVDASAQAQSRWQLGRWVDIGGVPALRWVACRNCSIAPRQLLLFYLSLCVVSMLIALLCALAGALPVLGFAGIELLAVGVALLVYARHAVDREEIVLHGEMLEIDDWNGQRHERTLLPSRWVRVEFDGTAAGLVGLRAQGRLAMVGRHLLPARRAELAAELRRALREAS